MIDTAVYWVRAEAAMRAGRWHDAVSHLRKLVQVVDRIDFEYEEWLRALADSLRALGQHRDAAACLAYLGATDAPGKDQLHTKVRHAKDGSSTALQELQLLGIYLSRSSEHASAPGWFEAAGMPIHEAIEYEKAGRDELAAEMWERLIEGGALAEQPYEEALARINHGLTLYRLGHDRARSALAEATSAVEEVADAFETEGLRERAFDSYQLLARIGLETETFENVAEGFLNSVRILKDDALKLDALRLYEAFVTLARRAEEHHAVAGILREAADYCSRVGLPYADDLRIRSGEAWVVAAQEATKAGHPNQIVENGYLAAAEAFVSVRAFRHAADVYDTLSQMELKGRDRYERLLARLGNSPEDGPRPVPVPEFLKRLPEYEEVWYVDLAEWELDGDPVLVAAGIMADRRFPDFVRRHALLLVLDMSPDAEPLAAVEIVERLQSVRAYPVIAALERLYAAGNPALKKAVAKALGRLRFKRSFTVLMEALRSTDSDVRKAASDSIGNLFFPHAFDRLRRIYETRDLPDAEQARVAALKAIGRINTIEALEFLCDRLREVEGPHTQHVTHAIQDLSNADLVPYLRDQIDLVPIMHRAVLEDAALRLSQRGR